MFSPAYKRYVLSMLTLVYGLNVLDRNLIVLLLQPIKEDLRLSDTQLGLLTGIAFGLFYAVLGLPVARWADRGNRAKITSIAIGLWGVTVMVYLFVSNFVQLALGRVASAVGESGCMPPTYSLLGDYFPKPAERAWAMSIYWLASPLASLVGFVLGGWLNSLYGWRVTFALMSIPALLIAVLVRLTVVDPRQRMKPEPGTERPEHRMLDVLGFLWRQPSVRHLCLSIILIYLLSLGLGPWYAAFLMRSHGMTTAEVGVWLGLIFGLAGTGGILAGGYAAKRWFSTDERAQLRLSAVAISMGVPCFALFLLVPEKHQALIAFVPFVVVLTVFLGPIFALLQRLVAGEMRARVLAIVMFLANLIGLGIGPLVVGVLSDLLRPGLGNGSLRCAMLSMSLVGLWAAYHLSRAGRTVREDLASVEHPPDRAVLA